METKRLRKTKLSKRQYLYIDSYAGTGRETLRTYGPMNKSISPSHFSCLEDDERTQKFINASFLPFFALLSIPPSFN